jgi:phage-related protein
MLFGQKPFNGGLWGGGASLAEVFSTDTLVFDNFSLSDGTTMILTGLRFLGPTREIIGGSVPRGHGMYQTADYFREVVIEAEGVVKVSTAALLDAQRDTIRKNLRKSQRNLDYTDANGTVKRFVATLDNFEELFADRQAYHVTFCPWKARFRCKVPFGKARGYTPVMESFTASPHNQTVDNTGTMEAQPVFILIFGTVAGVTTVTVENTTTDEQIQYSGSISTGDMLEFDSENKTVKKNGSEVDYSGSFPSLDTGSNVIAFTIDGTIDVIETTKFKETFVA